MTDVVDDLNRAVRAAVDPAEVLKRALARRPDNLCRYGRLAAERARLHDHLEGVKKLRHPYLAHLYDMARKSLKERMSFLHEQYVDRLNDEQPMWSSELRDYQSAEITYENTLRELIDTGFELGDLAHSVQTRCGRCRACLDAAVPTRQEKRDDENSRRQEAGFADGPAGSCHV